MQRPSVVDVDMALLQVILACSVGEETPLQFLLFITSESPPSYNTPLRPNHLIDHHGSTPSTS
eukprot:m.445252 g.445252  ORF g.445252 m.445252 type:complete len:63 (+) comp56847_c0_seq19:482-670(+)